LLDAGADFLFVAGASDGKSAFVSGLVKTVMDARQTPRYTAMAAVYRVKLPQRSPAA
jgi:hypothetical protein